MYRKNDAYLDIRKQVADAKHNIVIENLKDSQIEIKAKIRKRLRELGYMKYNYFIDIEKFWKDFKPFNFLQLNEKHIYRIIFSTPYKETPIAYILLILFLFKNWKCYFGYKLMEEELVHIEYSKDGYEHLYRSKFGERIIDEYNLYLKNHNGDKYEVISIQDDMLVIKHKLCGDIIQYKKIVIDG